MKSIFSIFDHSALRTPRSAFKGLLILLLSSIVLLPGCVRPLAPDGIYAGDTLLFQSEVATTDGYDVMKEYITWELENRAGLKKYPEIGKIADNIRLNAEQWVNTAIAAHDEYVLVKSPENTSKLKKAVSVIRTALNQAAAYHTPVPKVENPPLLKP